MTRGWAVWVLSVGLLASACGGRAADRGGPGNHTGSSSAGGGSAGVDVPGGGGESEPSAGASSSGFAMLSASEWNVRIQFKLRNPPQHILDAPNCGTAALTLDVFDDTAC